MATPPINPNPDPGMLVQPPENYQWAVLLLDEWKYRHAAVWKTLYRYTWYLVILIALPFVAEIARSKGFAPSVASFFTQFRKPGSWFVLCYWIPVLVLWVGATFILLKENRELRVVQDRLNDARGSYQPIRPGSVSLMHYSFLYFCFWAGGWGVIFICLLIYFLSGKPPNPEAPCQ